MTIVLNVLAGCGLLILVIALVWALKLNSEADPEFNKRIEELQNLLDLRRKDLE